MTKDRLKLHVCQTDTRRNNNVIMALFLRWVVGPSLGWRWVVLPVNFLRCFECCIGKQLCDFYDPVNLIARMGANFKHDCTGSLSDLSVLQTKMADVLSKMVGELCIVCFSGSIKLYLVKTWLHSVRKLWNYSDCGGTHNWWWLFSTQFTATCRSAEPLVAVSGSPSYHTKTSQNENYSLQFSVFARIIRVVYTVFSLL